jgi:hypothetical protein
MLGANLTDELIDGSGLGESRGAAKSSINLNTDGYGNGNLDLSQTDSTSIISTTTPQTIALRTWNLSTEPSITLTTNVNANGIELIKTEKPENVSDAENGSGLLSFNSERLEHIKDTANPAKQPISEIGRPSGEQQHSAARFFPALGYSSDERRMLYCPKAGKRDRANSKHPTIKPIKLLEWLCKLITPPGGTILDPFAGSGTTGQAATNLGFDCVLIEREAEYVADIKRRLYELTL